MNKPNSTRGQRTPKQPFVPGQRCFYVGDGAERAASTEVSLDDRLARCFDNMVRRAVPPYEAMQRVVEQLATLFAQANSTVFDLGCATGTTLAALDRLLPSSVRLVGVDHSPGMLAQARKKLAAQCARGACTLVQADLNPMTMVADASVVVMLMSLQCLHPLARERVLREIKRGLREGGCLIVFDRMMVAQSVTNRINAAYHEDMKRRSGHWRMPLAHEWELVQRMRTPYRVDENQDLLTVAGFRRVERVFQWYAYYGLLAVG